MQRSIFVAGDITRAKYTGVERCFAVIRHKLELCHIINTKASTSTDLSRYLFNLMAHFPFSLRKNDIVKRVFGV